MTVVVVDVHADDGVYSAGEWIAARRHLDVVVLTVLGAVPQGDDEAWVKQLLADKDTACDLLGARSINLPFLDGKYGVELRNREVASALRGALAELAPTEVLVPLGVRHADHLLVAPIALTEALATQARVCVYADLPYSVMYPDETAGRLDQLDTSEFAGGAGHLDEKRRACEAFSNQYGEDAQRCCFVYERIWVVRQ